MPLKFGCSCCHRYKCLLRLEDVTSRCADRQKWSTSASFTEYQRSVLAQRLGISRTEAAALIEQYFVKYSGIKKYMDTIQFAREHGYVETLLGEEGTCATSMPLDIHVVLLSAMPSMHPFRELLQDMIKVAMINIHQQLAAKKLQSRMILQVHDELLFDVYLPEKRRNTTNRCKRNAKCLTFASTYRSISWFGNNWLEAH